MDNSKCKITTAVVLILFTSLNLFGAGKGIIVSSNSRNAYLPASVRSEIYGKDDGTIVCWLEEANYGSVRLQKIDNTGSKMWDEEGVLADSHTGTGFAADSDYPLLFSDNKGGAVMIYRKVFFDREDIFMQKVDQYGRSLAAPACLSSYYGGYNYSPSAVMTDRNNIVITWENFSNGEFNIHAQMVDMGGNKLWNRGNEAVVCNVYKDQRKPTISCTDNDHIMFSWLDNRNYTEYSFDLFGNMLDSLGNSYLYTTKGKLLFRNVNQGNSRKNVLYNHNMIPSDNNSFVIAFEHSRDNQFSNVIAMKVNFDLDPEWVYNLQSGTHQSKPLLAQYKDHGAAIIWNDKSDSGEDIFGSVITKDGNIIWGSKTGKRISCDVDKAPFAKVLPSEKISNGFITMNDQVCLNWVTAGSEKLYFTNLNLTDESSQCYNTLEIQDNISEGEYTSVTLHGNNAVLVYRHSGAVYASIWNIPGKGFSQSDLKPVMENFPNPFNPSTNISFSIPSDGFVRLSVFDITGRCIKELVSENKPAGSYKISFNGSSFSSGVYFAKLEFNGAAHTKRITMIK